MSQGVLILMMVQKTELSVSNRVCKSPVGTWQQGIGRISTLTFERLCPGDNGFLEYRWHLSSTPWSNLPNLIVQSSLGVAWIQHSNPRDTIFSHSWWINEVLGRSNYLSQTSLDSWRVILLFISRILLHWNVLWHLWCFWSHSCFTIDAWHSFVASFTNDIA